MDEAKSMFQIGTYHNHIVNLQGITCKENKSSNQKAPEVTRNRLYLESIQAVMSNTVSNTHLTLQTKAKV